METKLKNKHKVLRNLKLLQSNLLKEHRHIQLQTKHLESRVHFLSAQYYPIFAQFFTPSAFGILYLCIHNYELKQVLCVTSVFSYLELFVFYS